MDPLNDDHRAERASTPVVERIALTTALGGGAGLAAAVVWGGIGGRIAMRVVFLTSSDTVRGVTSDDGFEIGRFSADTIVLVIFTAILGLIAGLGVGLVRALLPGSTAAVAVGVGTTLALAGGASIVHTGGVDFRFLDPLWLTVGLFVLLPGLWGASVVAITDRILGSGKFSTGSPARGAWPWLGVAAWLALGALALVGGLDLISDVRELRRVR